MTEPRATYDAGTFPTQPVGSARREIEILVSGAIDLFLEYRAKHTLAQFIGSTAIEDVDEFARSRAMGEVIDSLEAPSPTLAAMLAGPDLLHACCLALAYLEPTADPSRIVIRRRLAAAIAEADGIS